MFKTTIDSILKDFTVKVDKLHSIAARKLEDADMYNDVAKAATELREEAKNEAIRASNIASRIEALIG